MGYSFSNIQLRRPAAFSAADVPALADALMDGQGLQAVNSPEEADVTAVFYCPPGSPWISIYADVLEGDPETQIQKANALSALWHTDALAIFCFDSDYLFLNLLNPEEKIDLWASTGSAALSIRPARRSNFTAWRKKVPDPAALKACMQKKRVFAEECLYDLEDILHLPPSQSVGDGRDDRPGDGVFTYYFAAPSAASAGEPPALQWWCPPVTPCLPEQTTVLSAVSVGGASQGLAVVFSGKYVEKEEIRFSDTALIISGPHGEPTRLPVTLSKEQSSSGAWRYYGEIPGVRIPPKVSDRLPPAKQMRKQVENRLSLVFCPSGNSRKFMDITVHLIPLKNPAGQCGWTCWMYFGSKRACIEHLKEQSLGAFAPVYSPDAYDLDEE